MNSKVGKPFLRAGTEMADMNSWSNISEKQRSQHFLLSLSFQLISAKVYWQKWFVVIETDYKNNIYSFHFSFHSSAPAVIWAYAIRIEAVVKYLQFFFNSVEFVYGMFSISGCLVRHSCPKSLSLDFPRRWCVWLLLGYYHTMGIRALHRALSGVCVYSGVCDMVLVERWWFVSSVWCICDV